MPARVLLIEDSAETARLLAGALDLRATQPIDLSRAHSQLIEDLERHVEGRGGDRFEDDLCDRVIESGAGDGLT